jgi:autotransporter-associated beta strand protein
VDFGGALTFFGSASAKTYNVDAGQTVTFSGTLVGATSTVTPLLNADIVKGGEGTLALRENGSGYSGAVRVDAGEMIAGIAGALGSGNITVGIGLDTDPIAKLTVNASQTISSLTIGDNGFVVITAAAPAEAGVPSVVAVPEPAGAALLAFGALGLLGRRRRAR